MRQTLKRVAATLKSAEVPFALSGGYAARVYGGPEPEHDIDFMPLPGGVPTAVLLVAGDFTRHGSVAEVAAGEFADLGIPVIAVLGNHDYHAGALPGGPGP